MRKLIYVGGWKRFELTMLLHSDVDEMLKVKTLFDRETVEWTWGGLILQTSLVFPSLTLHFSTSLSLPSYTDQAGNSISIVAFYKVTLRVLYAFGNPVASCYRAADDAEWYNFCYSRILSAYGMALTIVWPAPSWHRPTMLHDKVFLRAADSHTLVYICSWIFVNYWIRQKKNHCRLNLPWNALVERILIFFR